MRSPTFLSKKSPRRCELSEYGLTWGDPATVSITCYMHLGARQFLSLRAPCHSPDCPSLHPEPETQSVCDVSGLLSSDSTNGTQTGACATSVLKMLLRTRHIGVQDSQSAYRIVPHFQARLVSSAPSGTSSAITRYLEMKIHTPDVEGAAPENVARNVKR